MRKHSIAALLSLAAAFAGIAPLVAQMPTSIATPRKANAKPAVRSDDKPASKPDAPLLPSAFAGWEAASPAKSTTDSAQADPANATALKEYGFTDASLGEYARSGEILKIRALRFTDASGAYGAYSFYRQSGWPKEDVGTGAASDNNRVLFWIGNVVVDSQFPHVSAMTGSQLRELASSIPVPAGNKALAPPILGNLPQKDMDGQTTHYALGPASYSGSGGVLPPELVGFDRGAETATATYKLRSGLATLTIINYPTPQMAAAQEKAIADYLKAGNTAQHPFTKPLQDSNPAALEVRRSGPLVAVVSGDPIQDEGHKLLASVHFDADMSAIPGEPSHDVQNFAKLILGIIVLVVVMFVAALVVAVFLGGGRAAFRVMRGKPASSMFDDEFTRLDLRD
jgi:hypothetical protein